MADSGATSTSPRSQTRGFLFADLRGYTAYVERLGDHAAAELLAAYRAIVREVVASSDGAEIRTEGDSFYVVYPSASAAVQGGLAILDAASRDWKPGSGPLPVGVGVHAGETAETSEGFIGSAVNIAARVCAAAAAGEVLVTDTVRGLTRTVLPVRFVPRGSPRLKGIAEPIPLFRVEISSGVGLSRVHPRPAGRRPGRTMAAVLVSALAILAVGAGVLALATSGTGNRPAASTPASAPPTSPQPSAEAPTAPPTAEPSASAAGGFPTRDEAQLLVQIPLAIRATCVRTTAAEGASGGFVSLRCDLPLGAEADTTWYDRFGGPGEVQSAYERIVERQQLPAGSCSAKQNGVAGRYDYGITIRGDILCYVRDGTAWLVWTHERDDIVAKASRADGDWKALFAWWLGVGPFLGPR